MGRKGRTGRREEGRGGNGHGGRAGGGGSLQTDAADTVKVMICPLSQCEPMSHANTLVPMSPDTKVYTAGELAPTELALFSVQSPDGWKKTLWPPLHVKVAVSPTTAVSAGSDEPDGITHETSMFAASAPCRPAAASTRSVVRAIGGLRAASTAYGGLCNLGWPMNLVWRICELICARAACTDTMPLRGQYRVY